MAQYTAIPVQAVAANGNILFDNSICCNRGWITHQSGSGVFTVKSGSCGCNCGGGRYRVTFSGNVATPTGTALNQIAFAITLNGEPLYNAVGMSYPAAVDQYNNIAMNAIIDVPAGCCFSLSIRNIGTLLANISSGDLTIERVSM